MNTKSLTFHLQFIISKSVPIHDKNIGLDWSLKTHEIKIRAPGTQTSNYSELIESWSEISKTSNKHNKVKVLWNTTTHKEYKESELEISILSMIKINLQNP